MDANNKNITVKTLQPLVMNFDKYSITLFADDMTCFLKDDFSHNVLFETLQWLGQCSGLKLIMRKEKYLPLEWKQYITRCKLSKAQYLGEH